MEHSIQPIRASSLLGKPNAEYNRRVIGYYIDVDGKIEKMFKNTDIFYRENGRIVIYIYSGGKTQLNFSFINLIGIYNYMQSFLIHSCILLPIGYALKELTLNIDYNNIKLNVFNLNKL